MSAREVFRASLLVSVLLQALAVAADRRDGQHDFDFESGTWKTHVSRLLHPLSGSTAWAQYDGTSVVSKIWNGQANLVELEADGASGTSS